MARYPGRERERRVPAAVLLDQVARIVAACGMREADARLVADTLVKADLRGIHSHGTLRVPDYIKKLTEDGVEPQAAPRIERQIGGAIVVDGANAMGQIAMNVAMQAVIAAAREHGLAMAAVGRSNHCGAMDYWAMQALPHDMIGIAGTNALPTMAPWGGIDKIVGMNPLAVAVPGDREPPIVMDIAFGMTAHGKILRAERGTAAAGLGDRCGRQSDNGCRRGAPRPHPAGRRPQGDRPRDHGRPPFDRAGGCRLRPRIGQHVGSCLCRP